ncbi:hypothetical protein M0766_29960 (plasmid) [Pseudomonas putida]|nr:MULTISPECIES: hypothetical protein [Pseudomonas]UPU95714.1 hypothetical protein M0766_29960 [Pseudomonas putida]
MRNPNTVRNSIASPGLGFVQGVFMSRPLSSCVISAVVTFAMSFVTCNAVCAFFVAAGFFVVADNLTVMEFRNLVWGEPWFWIAVCLLAVVCYVTARLPFFAPQQVGKK